MWTKARLQAFVAEGLGDAKFIAVSNREPFIHTRENDGIRCMQPASGLTTALHPIMAASGGVWVAHGSGSADRETVDQWDRVPVPPRNPAYSLRRVWLPENLEREYYYGLANQGLWPLCHIAYQRPVFTARDWESYRKVNQIFADAVLEEAGGGPAFVFIQDYHLALLPRILKLRNPNLVIAQFWHIPWPSRETVRTFPWKEELLDGMLGNDLLGFHLRYHCQNFLNTVDRTVEALVDPEHQNVTRNGGSTMVRPFPISIDFEQHCEEAAAEDVDRAMANWRERIGAGMRVGIGLDRIDYTKGIPERIRSIGMFLQRNPEFIGRFVFVQVGVPSRSAIPQYKALADQIDREVNEVNARWRRGSWEPILYVKRHLQPRDMMALHRLADFCLVTSLHDGMNLVAKEFVASRNDEDGVLILSRFTGAARELTSALLVNPFSDEEIAEAMLAALQLSPDERSARMRNMRSAVRHNNIYRWAGKILTTLLEIERFNALPPNWKVADRQLAAEAG